MDARAPACPRCGYDQSGAVAGWADACPLAGRCSECGMGFRWGEVLDPRVLGPRWSFEHGEWATMGRFLRTSAVALWPWKLASDLRLEDRVRPRRLVLFALVWVAAWPALFHLAYIGHRLLWPGERPSGLGEWAALVAWPYGDAAPLEAVAWALSLFGFCFLPGLLMILWMSILDTTFSRGRVRCSQRMRGLCYFTPSAALIGPSMIAAYGLAAVVWGRLFYQAHPEWFPLAIALAWIGWVGAWWKQFIGRYLRIGRSGFIATILTIPTVLGTAVILRVFGILVSA